MSIPFEDVSDALQLLNAEEFERFTGERFVGDTGPFEALEDEDDES